MVVIDIGLIALTFGTIFLLELPDKTFVATLVLSTRYRPLAVWIGVGLAFGVQCLVAVTAGQVISLPMHAYLDAPIQDRIIDATRRALR